MSQGPNSSNGCGHFTISKRIIILKLQTGFQSGFESYFTTFQIHERSTNRIPFRKVWPFFGWSCHHNPTRSPTNSQPNRQSSAVNATVTGTWKKSVANFWNDVLRGYTSLTSGTLQPSSTIRCKKNTLPLHLEASLSWGHPTIAPSNTSHETHLFKTFRKVDKSRVKDNSGW